MAFNAVIHYPNNEKDRSKLIGDITTYRLLILRDYLSKIDTSSGNKIKIIDSLLQDKKE